MVIKGLEIEVTNLTRSLMQYPSPKFHRFYRVSLLISMQAQGNILVGVGSVASSGVDQAEEFKTSFRLVQACCLYLVCCV